MRFIKHQNTNLRNVYGKGVKYDIDDQVFMDSNNSVLIPKGTTADRPLNAPSENGGHMRFNTDLDDDGNEIGFEVYYDNAWRRLRFSEPRTAAGIHLQTLGLGDAIETIFGPLDSNDPFYPVPIAAENILVFVENVYQLPYTNYTLVQNPGGPYIISSITSIDGVTGYPTVVTTSAHGLTTGDLVAISGVELPGDADPLENLNIGDDSSSPFSAAVTVINPTTVEIHIDCTGGTPGNYIANSGKLYLAGSVTGPYLPGWYIAFSSAVDLAKPVTVLHNFDK